MSKEEKVEKKSLSQREDLWQKFVANYKAKNPVKFALKDARGEFKNIPDTFVGKVAVSKGKEVIY